MKNVLLLLVLAFALTACGGGAHKATMPDGSTGYSINCNGEDSDWSECYNEAAELCDGPYEIIATNTSNSEEMTVRNIMVTCKKK